MRMAKASLLCGLVCLSLAGCGTTGSHPDPQVALHAWGESEGFRCVDSVPSLDSVEAMVTCQRDDDNLVLGVFESQQMRDDHGGFLYTNSDVINAEGEWWTLTGTSQEFIDAAAEDLGATN